MDSHNAFHMLTNLAAMTVYWFGSSEKQTPRWDSKCKRLSGEGAEDGGEPLGSDVAGLGEGRALGRKRP